MAEVYLRFRDSCLESNGAIPTRYAKMITAADILIRGLAEVGIIALVDEATGFQDVRQRQALQKILDQYLRTELAAWAKRFPDDFYKEMFRLKNWDWKHGNVQRPQVVGRYTTDLVYDRLAPGITDELRERMPKTTSGKKKGRLHQLFTDDVGHPALAQHLHTVISFMRASNNWDDFRLLLDRALPRKGNTLELPLGDVPSSQSKLPYGGTT